MYLNDLNSSQHNVDKLNKILANTFKHDVDLSEMSTDSLNRMLNTTNAKMTAIKESDLKYWENPQYNKLGLIAHQIKTLLLVVKVVVIVSQQVAVSYTHLTLPTKRIV